jgi:penicillin-binding protein 2
VNKQRRQDHNLLQKASETTKPVEVGAIWSTPDAADPSKRAEVLHAGHFLGNPSEPTKEVARKPLSMGALFNALPLRWKEGLR